MITGAADVTGDGTPYNVIWDTTFTNQSTSYSTATGIFTAPVTGRYVYNTQIALRDLLVGHTTYRLGFFVNGGNRNTTYGNPYSLYSTSDNYACLQQSGIANLTAGDTLQFSVTVLGSTKTVDVAGLSVAGTVTNLAIFLLAA